MAKSKHFSSAKGTAFFQRAVENMSTAVLALDAQLRVSGINPAGEMLFESSANQIIGEPFAALLPANPALLDSLRQSLAAGHPFTERGLVLHLLGERSVTVDCTVNVLASAPGADAELLLEIVPIDRLLRLTREGQLLDQQLINREVIRGLAHEIKNPLGGLRGAAQLLERQLADKALKEYTSIIMREADRLRNLVDRMIGPTRPLAKTEVNIHEVFEHVRSLVLAESPDGVRIDRDYDPSLPPLYADPEQLIQAILNIVRNAVQVLKDGGTVRLRSRIERQFTIGHKRHRLVVRAEVEDNGPGIPVELLERVFVPMVTGRAEGMGLGLAIAQAIANRHGGLIECRSRPGHTVFTVYLPLENGDGQTG